MQYISTRNKKLAVSGAKAIVQGLSAEGGLYVPEAFPEVLKDDFESFLDMDYAARAHFIIGKFLPELKDVLPEYTQNAYAKFDDGDPAPLVKINDTTYMLELWHGPTCAFKAMALQLLPHLLKTSANKVTPGKTTLILTATSGDTGKAALDGFKDIEGIKIDVFYPVDGVSDMQRMQMVTQEGDNVYVSAIKGNFDDAQTGVKNIFSDRRLVAELAGRDIQLSSANSINWGRLAPQIVYYISAYCDLLSAGKINMGDPVNIVVPTGNFGNILAAYYAGLCGLPVGKLICASNQNKVLTDFIKTGIYDARRRLHVTTSPSMDILISSNLERLLYELSDKDDSVVGGYMSDLKNNGVYTVSKRCADRIKSLMYGGFLDDVGTGKVIRRIWEEYDYLCDTHTAVGIGVHEQYVKETGDNTIAIIASTASPYKFSGSVLKALGVPQSEDEFANLDTLSQKTGTNIPAGLAELKNKPVRFNGTIAKEDMSQEILAQLTMDN